MSALALTVERLRDTRQRLRLGLPVREDLDELLDVAAELLEDAEEAVGFLEAVEAVQ